MWELGFSRPLIFLRKHLMLKLFKKIYKTGLIKETLDLNNTTDQEFLSIGKRCKQLIDKYFAGSLAIRHVDAGSCNGCELEIHALNNVFYNLERYGIHFVASPRHADMLLVTGAVSKNMESALIDTYNAMPNPKLVLAIGTCGVNGGEFKNSYATYNGVADVLPVDGFVHGCPPQPIHLLQGILQVINCKYCSCSCESNSFEIYV